MKERHISVDEILANPTKFVIESARELAKNPNKSALFMRVSDVLSEEAMLAIRERVEEVNLKT